LIYLGEQKDWSVVTVLKVIECAWFNITSTYDVTMPMMSQGLRTVVGGHSGG